MKNARTMKDLGQLIRLHRQRNNLTQKALADMCGVSQVSVSKLEHGTGGSLQTFTDVMKALKVELSLTPIKRIDTKNLADLLE